MESVTYSHRARNPKENAGILSSIFFWWTYYVIKKGHSKPYDVEDLPAPLQNDIANNLGNRMETLWFEEIKLSKTHTRNPSLLRVIVKTFWKEFMGISLLHAFSELFIRMGSQLLMGYFILCLKEETMKHNFGTLLYAGILLIIFNGMDSVFNAHMASKSVHLGCRISIALSSLVYRKCLRLGNSGAENNSAGSVVNLLSNDLILFQQIILYCNFMWSGFVSTFMILVLVCHILGIYPAVALSVTLFFSVPFQIALSKSMARNRSKTAQASGKRIQIMDEIICGIQIIKMYAWEKPYEALIGRLRKTELKLLRKNLYFRGIQVATAISLLKCTMYSLIVVYALLGGQVLPEKVFTLLGCCSILARTVFGLTFRAFGECSQCYVSIKRIQNFLGLKEFNKLPVNKRNDQKYAIKFADVKASWSLDANRCALKNVSLTINKGQLTTIVGQVGSGKSSLLNVILGELPTAEGKLDIRGSISYYGQVPWIFAGTIKANILFCEIFEKSRYDYVVEVCGLQNDFQNLADGDLTLIGERGVTLSGGQKARIALARAIYRNADIYLLDDPLSAVDVKICKHIFENCILGFLKEKTRILVTHQLQYLSHSDKIIFLQEGTVGVEGTFGEVMASNEDYLNNLRETCTTKEEEASEQIKIQSFVDPNTDADVKLSDPINENRELEKEDNEKTNSHALMEYFLNGAGIKGVSIVILLGLITQSIYSGCDIWLSLWTHYTVSYQNKTIQETWPFLTLDIPPLKFFVAGHTILVILVAIFCLLRNASYAFFGHKCSKRIHDDSFHAVIRTDSSFFHCNPPGRILNRFSKDLGIVDNSLPLAVMDATSMIMLVASALIIATVINSMYLVPAFIVFLLSLLLVRRFYMKTSVHLKRLENITKSPVFVHLHSTLQGLPVIRVSSAEHKFIEQFDQYQDVHTAAWYLYYFTATGFGYSLEILCFPYLVISVVSCFFIKSNGSEIGLALSQVAILLNFISWAMRQATEVSNQVTSIDRLLKYSSLPPESEPEEDLTHCDLNWPSKGKISFEDVSLRYNKLSAPSIHGVSFTVEPQEKVGIVGRTGAGKTSLLAALFRLATVEGSIKIDDVDTSTVRLQNLRSKISVIPQDPILFSGTIRKNLDPFDEYDDSILWDALSEAELKSTISKSDGAGLDSAVSDGGKNFSVGQRQLICLARAIIRNNKILVLDEATANVDVQTDSIIQKTIRKAFTSCTVLTIAHRLNTIMHSDKILVMDNGTYVEYDHPYKLLLNPESFFYKLVQNSGEHTAAVLTEVAKKNYSYRQQDDCQETKT